MATLVERNNRVRMLLLNKIEFVLDTQGEDAAESINRLAQAYGALTPLPSFSPTALDDDDDDEDDDDEE